jgi:prevent-host-death family protein
MYQNRSLVERSEARHLTPNIRGVRGTAIRVGLRVFGDSLLELSRDRAICDQLYGQEQAMKRINLADAKAHLSELVERAAAGDLVCITRCGRAVAQITAIDVPRKRIDVSALRAMTDAMPVQPETARDFVRMMRDADRY